MADRKTVLIDIFEDTKKFICEDSVLSVAEENSISNTKIYSPKDYPDLKRVPRRQPSISITKKRTFESALDMHDLNPEAKICVLNFASPINPGGGVAKGSSAQEECLCRCSTLYGVLNKRYIWKNYYEPNRENNNPLNDDTVVYTPDIVICKTDESEPKRLAQRSFVRVDVVSCAAPNLRKVADDEYSFLDLYSTHYGRAKHILHVMALNRANNIVLGAFGCGAFKNDPNIVAQAWNDALADYMGYFDVIEFAIYCNRWDTDNYDAFKRHIKVI